jgi:hypothetical protein
VSGALSWSDAFADDEPARPTVNRPASSGGLLDLSQYVADGPAGPTDSFSEWQSVLVPETDDRRRLDQNLSRYRNTQSRARALGIEEETDGGFLAGIASVLDAPRRFVFENLVEPLTGADEGAEGFGDLEPLQFADDDAWWERALKATGAFVGDVATDPLTYLTLGTGTLGKKAATEAAEKAARGLASQAVRTGDDAARWAGRLHTERLADEAFRARRGAMEAAGEGADELLDEAPDSVAGWIVRGQDEGVETLTREIGDDRLRELATEGFASEAATAFARGKSRGLRQFLTSELGEEAGERAFRSLPTDLRGGVRFSAPFVREKSPLGVSTPRSFALTPGGGQLTDRAGLGRVAEAGLQAQNRARAMPGVSTVMDRTSGRLGRMYGQVIKDLYGREDDLARVGWSKYQAARDLMDRERGWLTHIEGEIDDEQLVIAGLLDEAPDAGKAREAYRRFFHDPGDRLENLAAPPEGMDASEAAGWSAAQRAHRNVIGRLGKEAHELFDGDMGWISEYVPRFMREEEKQRRRRVQAVSGRTARGGEANPTKQRQRFAAELEYDEASGEVRVARWMNVDEANAASRRSTGEDIFKSDPGEIVADYASAMKGLMRRERYVRGAERLGLLVDGGRTTTEFSSPQAFSQIVGDAHQTVLRERGRAQRDLDGFLGLTGRRSAAETPLEDVQPAETVAAGAPARSTVGPAPAPSNADEARGAEIAAARQPDGPQPPRVQQVWDDSDPVPRPFTPDEQVEWERLSRASGNGRFAPDGEYAARAEALSARIARIEAGQPADEGERALLAMGDGAVDEALSRWRSDLDRLSAEWEDAEQFRELSRLRQAQQRNGELGRVKARLLAMDEPRPLAEIDRDVKRAYAQMRDAVEDPIESVDAGAYEARLAAEARLEGLRAEEQAAHEWHRLKGLADQHRTTDGMGFLLENYARAFDEARTFTNADGFTMKARFPDAVDRDLAHLDAELSWMDQAISEVQATVDEATESAERMPDTMFGTPAEGELQAAVSAAEAELSDLLETYNRLGRAYDSRMSERVAALRAEEIAAHQRGTLDASEVGLEQVESVDEFLAAAREQASDGRPPLDTLYDEAGVDRPERVARIEGEDVHGQRIRELEAKVAELNHTEGVLKEFLDAANLPSDPQAFEREMDSLIGTIGRFEAERVDTLRDDLARAVEAGDDEMADKLQDALDGRRRRLNFYGSGQWKRDVFTTRDLKSEDALSVMDRGLEPVLEHADQVRDPERFADLLGGESMRFDLEQMFRKRGGNNDAIDAFVDGFWNPYYTAFKTWATIGRGTGYHARNIVGGMWNAFLRDVNAGHFKMSGDMVATEGRALRAARKAAPDADDATHRRMAEAKVRQTLKDKHGQRVLHAYDAYRALGIADVNRNLESLVAEGSLADAPMAARGNMRGLWPQARPSELTSTQRALNKTVDNPWIKTGARAASMSEDYLRFATFLKGVDDYGLDDDGLAASLLVKATQFDYADLDPVVEARVLRQIMPFYVFTRRSIPLNFRGLATKPGQVNKLLRANEQAERLFGAEEDEWGDLPNDMRLELGLPLNDREMNEYLPEWVKERFGWVSRFSFGGSPITVGIESPVTDLNKWIEADGSIDFREALSQTNPLGKVAVESATGTSLFTGAQMRDRVEAPLWAAPFADTVDGQRVMSGRLHNAITQLLPPLSQADRVAGLSPQSRERQLTSVLANFAALPVSTLSPRQQSGELMARSDALLDRMQTGVPNYTQANEMAKALLDAGATPEQAGELLATMGVR